MNLKCHKTLIFTIKILNENDINQVKSQMKMFILWKQDYMRVIYSILIRPLCQIIF